MEVSPSLLFPPFRLDLGNEQLWRGAQELELRPKTFAVLRYLAQHPGQLVTKDEILDSVWPQTVVSDSVLKNCIRELRKALGDEALAPQYIETVHRRGYRFIAPLTTTPSVRGLGSEVQSQQNFQPAPNSQSPTPTLVGRETELAQLHRLLEKALNGQRQIVFITGEPGIGKTTLVETFLFGVRSHERFAAPKASPQTPNPELLSTPRLLIGRGQCIEQYGTGEAYLPVLEALGRLCREPGGERFIALLNQYAPTWLVQMPALLSATGLETLQRKVAGATRERMLREMVETVDALTAEQPLVLWFEDLHWSDVSTQELLALLARRQERARLLVLGTYRPMDVIVQEHSLKEVKQELQLHGRCAELSLGWLSEAAVAEYLAVRFGTEVEARQAVSLQNLAQVIHQHTEGNPLFMVNVVEHMVAQGAVVQVEGQWALRGKVEDVVVNVPDNLQQTIEHQLDRSRPDEQRMLEVASVVGMEFSAAVVAAGVEAAEDTVEEQCAGLVRRGQFLRANGREDWPDGTVAARYGFLHALYQEVIYERVSTGRRAHLHQRIGERTEAGYGKRAGEIAAELAVHFEQGRDYPRAVQYCEQAGRNAIRRSANQEAIRLLTKGLELLKTLPDTSERAQQELSLRLALGPPLIATKGYSAPEAEQAHARAQELCRQLGDTSQLVSALWGLWAFYLVRADHQMAWQLAGELLTVAQNQSDSLFLPEAHLAPGLSSFYRGEFTASHEYLEKGLSYFDPRRPRSRAFLQAPGLEGVSSLSYLAWTLWSLGYADHALQRAQAALTLAEESSHPFSVVYALEHLLVLHQFRREVALTQDTAEATIKLCTEHGFSFYLSQAIIPRGWALTEQGRSTEGMTQIREGLAARRATGAHTHEPYYLALLAESYGKTAKPEEGLHTLNEALAFVRKTEEREYEAELYRLKGQLVLQSGVTRRRSKSKRQKSKIPNTQHPIPSTQAEAEAGGYFLKAIEIARKQQAKSLELRAVMSLSRLWQQQGKKKHAHQMLSEIYNWFTEGFDTADLKEAKALLEELD